VTSPNVSFDQARALVERLMPEGWRTLPDGYEDDRRYLVRYESTTGDPGWDLDIITVDKQAGHVIRMPWFIGYQIPESMRPVRSEAEPSSGSPR